MTITNPAYVSVSPPDESSSQYCLGTLENIGNTSNSNDVLLNWTQCRIYFNKNQFVFYTEGKETASVTLSNVTNTWKDLRKDLKKKISAWDIFRFEFIKVGNNLSVKLYIILPLPNESYGAEIKKVFSKVLGIEIADTKEPAAAKQPATDGEIRQFYQESQRKREELYPTTSKINVQHDSLKTTLTPYQENAVRWMIEREQTESENSETENPLYEEVPIENGISIYFDKYNGDVQIEKPVRGSLTTGGLLADDIGLGKTVEVLACILSNPKLEEHSDMQAVQKTIPSSPKVLKCTCGTSDDEGRVQCIDCEKYQHKSCYGYEDKHGPYRCPQCWMKAPCLESKCTLIVTPPILNKQWIEETKKHLKEGVKVLNYEGSKKAVYPTDMITYDIVLTTYTIVSKELQKHSDAEQITRGNTRYSSPGSPLAVIKWWRLCLDEAQKVQTTTNLVPQRVEKLKAHHRWAVTGTPISQKISDLYGIIGHQLKLCDDDDIWNYTLYFPYLLGKKDPLYKFFARIMWRLEKDDPNVRDEMGVETPTIEIHEIHFSSSVEEYFYNNKLNLNTKKISDIIEQYENYDIPDKNIKDPLTDIRKACNGIKEGKIQGWHLNNRKRFPSMDDKELKTMLQQYVSSSCSECKKELDRKFNAVTCQHRYCLACMTKLVDKADKNDMITCFVCGEVHHLKSISCIKIGEQNDNRLENCSTKIEEIIKLVLKLRKEENDVQILIFSTWDVVLHFLQEALKVVGVIAKIPPQNPQPTLENFNSSKLDVLLLAIKWGAGLNITKATHVILAEPLPDPATEKQAIGRIDRFGQTKPTFVHKFIMKNTIEEGLDRLTSSNTRGITIGDIKELILTDGESHGNRDEALESVQPQPVQIEGVEPGTSVNEEEPNESDIEPEIISEEAQHGDVTNSEAGFIPHESDTDNAVPSTSGTSSNATGRKRKSTEVENDGNVSSKLQILYDHTEFWSYVKKEFQYVKTQTVDDVKRIIHDAVYKGKKGTLSEDSKIVP